MIKTFFHFMALPIYGIIVMYMLLDVKLNKISKKRKLTIMIFFFISLSVYTYFFMTRPPELISKLYPIIVQLPMFIGFSIITEYRGFKLLFLLITTIFTVIPITQTPHILAYFGIDLESGRVIARCLYPFLIIFIYKVLKPKLDYVIRNKNDGWGIICIFPICAYIATAIISGYSFSAESFAQTAKYRIAITLVIYTAYLTMLLFFSQTSKSMQLENENKLMKIFTGQSENEIMQLKNYQHQADIYRHDLRHHMQFIYTCIEQRNYDQALSYINNTISTVESSKIKRYCDNDTINMILSSYISDAENMGIKCSLVVQIDNELNISDVEICSILSNAFENAIKACEKLKDKEKAYIKILLRKQNNKLALEISNYYDEDLVFENGIPISSKEGHGFGVKSIAYMVEKNKGIWNISTKNSVFTLRILL